MAKFEAEKLDLDLDLKTLSGEKVDLSPKIIINASKTVEIMQQWQDLEAENKPDKKDKKDEREKKISPFELVATELEMIYPKPKKWWMDNFDIPTLGKIMTHIAETIGGVKKKEPSSK